MLRICGWFVCTKGCEECPLTYSFRVLNVAIQFKIIAPIPIKIFVSPLCVPTPQHLALVVCGPNISPVRIYQGCTNGHTCICYSRYTRQTRYHAATIPRPPDIRKTQIRSQDCCTSSQLQGSRALRLRARLRLTASTLAAEPMLVGGPHSGRARQHAWPASFGKNACTHKQPNELEWHGMRQTGGCSSPAVCLSYYIAKCFSFSLRHSKFNFGRKPPNTVSCSQCGFLKV